MIAHVCDYGERVVFEKKARSEGFLKIYDKIYPFWEDLIRIDSMPYSSQKYTDYTQDTARFTAFYNHSMDTLFCKFGCVFVLDSKKLFNASESQVKEGLTRFLKRYASKHFNEESLNMLLRAHLRTFFAFKKIYKVA